MADSEQGAGREVPPNWVRLVDKSASSRAPAQPVAGRELAPSRIAAKGYEGQPLLSPADRLLREYSIEGVASRPRPHGRAKGGTCRYRRRGASDAFQVAGAVKLPTRFAGAARRRTGASVGPESNRFVEAGAAGAGFGSSESAVGGPGFVGHGILRVLRERP